ncbi:hypothetical protein P9112_009994 [Eukaryota sp. TZLM1-RC]
MDDQKLEQARDEFITKMMEKRHDNYVSGKKSFNERIAIMFPKLKSICNEQLEKDLLVYEQMTQVEKLLLKLRNAIKKNPEKLKKLPMFFEILDMEEQVDIDFRTTITNALAEYPLNGVEINNNNPNEIREYFRKVNKFFNRAKMSECFNRFQELFDKYEALANAYDIHGISDNMSIIARCTMTLSMTKMNIGELMSDDEREFMKSVANDHDLFDDDHRIAKFSLSVHDDDDKISFNVGDEYVRGFINYDITIPNIITSKFDAFQYCFDTI